MRRFTNGSPGLPPGRSKFLSSPSTGCGYLGARPMPHFLHGLEHGSFIWFDLPWFTFKNMLWFNRTSLNHGYSNSKTSQQWWLTFRSIFFHPTSRGRPNHGAAALGTNPRLGVRLVSEGEAWNTVICIHFRMRMFQMVHGKPYGCYGWKKHPETHWIGKDMAIDAIFCLNQHQHASTCINASTMDPVPVIPVLPISTTHRRCFSLFRE